MYNMIRNLVYSLIRERFHAQRANAFLALMKPQDGFSILDVGGGVKGDFLARIRDRVQARFVVADVAEMDEYYIPVIRRKYDFEFVQLKEDKPLPFGDKEFDIVVSNSVIEHVTMTKEACMSGISQEEWISKSLQRQRQFADEIRRVGKMYFVQTPHKDFPIELHTWLPFVNFLNHQHTVSLVRYTNKYWVQKCGYVNWNLLSFKQMKQFFPEALIRIERVLGLPKAIIAFTSKQPDNNGSVG